MPRLKRDTVTAVGTARLPDTQNYLTGLFGRAFVPSHIGKKFAFSHTCCRASSRRNAALAHAYVHVARNIAERVRLIIRDYVWEEDRHELGCDKAKSPLSHAGGYRPDRQLPAMSRNTFLKTSTRSRW